MKHLILSLLLAVSALAATPADYAVPITASGDYSYPATIPAGNSCTFALAGNFSGAAVTPGYITAAGAFTALGSAVTAPATVGPYFIPLGPVTGKGTAALSLAGGVSPAITLAVTQVNPGEIPLNAASITDALGYTPAGPTELATKQALLTGVIVTTKAGVRTAYPPAADTDTARGDALEAAFAVSVAGDTLDLSPGNFYIDKPVTTVAGVPAQFALLNKMTIRLNGARLYKKSTDTASSMFTCVTADSVNDWSIIGPGMLDGSYIANADTAARGSGANEIGISVRASRRVKIENIIIKNMAGSGILGWNTLFVTDEYGTGSNAKYSTVQINSCNIDLNNRGLEVYVSNEYWRVSNSTFNKNQTGIDDYQAGNMAFTGCEANGNTDYALRIRDGGNDGHGTWTGGAINHNTGFAVYVETGMVNGFIFTGTNFYADSSTANKIESLGGGVQFVGCTIDSPFYAGSTPSGINTVKACHFPLTGVTAAQAISDLAAAERNKWKFIDNHTLSGVWASDDIFTQFATNAAALTGGRLPGELYQITGTGAVMVTQP